MRLTKFFDLHDERVQAMLGDFHKGGTVLFGKKNSYNVNLDDNIPFNISSDFNLNGENKHICFYHCALWGENFNFDGYTLTTTFIIVPPISSLPNSNGYYNTEPNQDAEQILDFSGAKFTFAEKSIIIVDKLTKVLLPEEGVPTVIYMNSDNYMCADSKGEHAITAKELSAIFPQAEELLKMCLKINEITPIRGFEERAQQAELERLVAEAEVAEATRLEKSSLYKKRDELVETHTKIAETGEELISSGDGASESI